MPQRETVPDAVVRAADQVELVDMSPEALRRRLAHGNVYGPEKIDAALGNYFRVGNLTALRELALLWLADTVDEGLQRYRARHGIHDTWEARERVVVALTGGPEGDTLIRRAARIAARTGGGDLLAVHVSRSDGLVGSDPASLGRQRRLVESLGGSYHQVVGDDIATALLEFARAENATQLVLGASTRSRLSVLATGSIGATVVRLSGSIDVHMVTHPHAARRGGLPALRGGLTLRRRLLGLAVAVVLLPALTGLLALDRHALNLTSDMLLFLLSVIVTALVGGLRARPDRRAGGLAAAELLLHRAAAHVHHRGEEQRPRARRVRSHRDAREQPRRPRGAAHGRGGPGLRRVADAGHPGRHGAARQHRAARPARPCPGGVRADRRDPARAQHGPGRPGGPGGPGKLAPGGRFRGLHVHPAGGRRRRGARRRGPRARAARPDAAGRTTGACSARCAAQAATALEQQRLAEEAAAARPHVEADRMRTALLAAVGHDLRTPLASAKASVTSLRSPRLRLGDVERPSCCTPRTSPSTGWPGWWTTCST